MALDRKSLKQPDEFVATTRGLVGNLANHKKALALTAALAALAVLGSLGYVNMTNAREQEAGDALYLARQTLDEEIKKVAAEFDPKPKSEPKKAAAKGAQKDGAPAEEPEWQPDPRAIAFRAFDVDAKLAKSVEQLSKVAQEHEGTRAGYEAAVTLGDLYHDHGAPKKALEWYGKAEASAPGAFEKALVQRARGYALENSGEYGDAVKAYEKALNYGVASLKGDLLLAVARGHEELKQLDKAKETYDRILSELPNTSAARSAELFKSRI